jgi:hypothetical protein
MKYDLQKCLDVCPLCGGGWINTNSSIVDANYYCENCKGHSLKYVRNFNPKNVSYTRTFGADYQIGWHSANCIISCGWSYEITLNEHLDFNITKCELEKVLMLV